MARRLSRRERAIQAAYRVETDLYDVERATVRRIRRELEDAREATVGRLARATAEWDIRQSQALLAEIERQMVVWENALASSTASAMRDAHTLGREQALAAARAGGVEVMASPTISSALLSVSQQTLPMLIRDIGQDTTRRIARILRGVTLGQQTPYEAMREISRFLPARGGDGPFGAAFRRAESVIRTEVGRISQTANYSTLAEMHRRDSAWLKEWHAALDGKTRQSHGFAHLQRQPVDKPYRVGGSYLLYPHDPRGPAAETVNCRCISVPIHETWTTTGPGPSALSILGL